MPKKEEKRDARPRKEFGPVDLEAPLKFADHKNGSCRALLVKSAMDKRPYWSRNGLRCRRSTSVEPSKRVKSFHLRKRSWVRLERGAINYES